MNTYFEYTSHTFIYIVFAQWKKGEERQIENIDTVEWSLWHMFF